MKYLCLKILINSAMRDVNKLFQYNMGLFNGLKLFYLIITTSFTKIMI